MIRHSRQLIHDVTEKVNNLRDDMMMRIQKIKCKIQKLGKKIRPDANFILDSSMEVRDELSVSSDTYRGPLHQKISTSFIKKKSLLQGRNNVKEVKA